jgi:hypothetical protein
MGTMSQIPEPVSVFLFTVDFFIPSNVETAYYKVQSTSTRHGITPLRSFGPLSARFISDHGLSHHWHAILYSILRDIIVEEWYTSIKYHMEESGMSTGDLADGLYAAFLGDVGDVGI